MSQRERLKKVAAEYKETVKRQLKAREAAKAERKA